MGDEEWQEEVKATLHRLKTSDNDLSTLTFAGVHISAQNDALAINQYFYMHKVKVLPENGSFEQYTSMQISIARLAYIRLDPAFKSSRLDQVIQTMFDENISRYLK